MASQKWVACDFGSWTWLWVISCKLDEEKHDFYFDFISRLGGEKDVIYLDFSTGLY